MLSYLWELQNFTSSLFEIQVKQITLEMFFKKENIREQTLWLYSWEQEHVCLKAYVLCVILAFYSVKNMMFSPFVFHEGCN
jgi:hypothetical protein